MTSHEPVLHALSVEPRVARPGETVSVIFRTRNLGTAPSPAGTVAFFLGDGLEALDAAESSVASVAPGDDVVAVLQARVARPLDDRTELVVQAVLRVPDAELGTNICAVRVRSRPVLDGAASGTFVEVLDADHVRVRAIVTNEGDGAARDVRVAVAAPHGCVRVDAEGPAVAEAERLEVGASVSVAFAARIVAPVSVVAADEGAVHYGTMRRCMLPVREVVVLEPVIAAPCASMRPSRRSVDVGIDVRNDGWVDARDVRVRIAFPAPLRAIDASVTVDGVPIAARARRGGSGDISFARVGRSGGAHVVIAQVRAQSTARIGLTATFPAGYGGGTIVAGAGDYEVTVGFTPERARDVRMRLVETPRFVAPGAEVAIVGELVNAGDIAEDLFFCVTGPGIVVAPEALARTIVAGSIAVVALTARVDVAAPCGEPLRLSVVACDAERERARADFGVVVRDQPVACCDEADDSSDESLPAVVHAAVCGPNDISAGAAFALRVDIDVEDPVDRLGVRVRDVPGARYVCGSASLDGRSLLDRGGSSPLGGDGLLLRSVPAGTRVTAAWMLLADAAVCDEALKVEAVLSIDGVEQPCDAIAVRVLGRDAFAAQPAGLPYHVDACVIGAAPSPVISADALAERAQQAPKASAVVEDAPFEAPSLHLPQFSPSSEDAFTFALQFNEARLDEIARMLRVPNRGLVGHVIALRTLLPDEETSGDRGIASMLDGVRGAVGDVLDRLFVKLRIPGFDVASDDVDDVVVRSAMVALFEALLTAAPRDRGCDGAMARLTRDRVRELLSAFAGAPYGAPAVLRALVALLPTHCERDPALGSAFARYAIALDDALARYEGLPLELFDDALTRASDRVLDDARGALALALDERGAFAELAC